MTDPIRAALAEQQGEGLSDEELLQIAGHAACIDNIQESWEEMIPVELTAAEILSICRAVLARWGQQPAPLVAGAPGPSMEDVGPLIAWLTEQACQAADASQPADAGMLTWAAQVIGERVNEDAPVAGEVAEPVAEGPKDEEVEAWADDQGFIRGHGDHPCGFWIDDGDVGALVRAALARWGRQPAPHDDRGVLPMVISDTGASDEPERERIICASISGGADYINNMPRMLILERIELHKGSICRRYIQEPTLPAEGEVAELVAALQADAECLAAEQPDLMQMTDKQLARAAELLQQQEAEILTSTGKLMTDYRALCAELFKACETLYKQSVTASHHQTITLSNGEHPIPISSDMLAQDAVFGDLLHRTRAALAELASDGPAVPESREPASVAGKSSDENCWQWYTYCPEEGLEMYSDRKQAQSAAQSIMGSYEVAAHSDGWHEDMELVSWGMLVPVEQAQVVERKTAEPDDEFDEWVKYELRPVRWDHQPTPPAEGEVGELLAELEVAAVTVESEGGDHEAGAVRRAAELLQQQHPTPVPVSEGLPGAADIHFEFVVSDADYCTQAGGTAPTCAQALSEGQRYLAQYQQYGPHTLELRRVEVLHPGALPVHPAPVPVAEQQGEGERRWTEGICGDGAAILFDGVMVPVHEVVRALNCHRSQPPAEGEVAKLVEWLRENAEDERQMCESSNRASLNLERAAELLQRQHPAPVPVSERLPGDQLCWWYEPDEPDGYGGRWNLLRIRGGTGAFSHWLPAHALPLPQGEVEG